MTQEEGGEKKPSLLIFSACSTDGVECGVSVSVSVCTVVWSKCLRFESYGRIAERGLHGQGWRRGKYWEPEL